MMEDALEHGSKGVTIHLHADLALRLTRIVLWLDNSLPTVLSIIAVLNVHVSLIVFNQVWIDH